MKASENFKFTFHGFSAKRMAYLLTFVSTLLLPFHTQADGRGDEYLCEVALGFVLIALVLGFFVSRTDKTRFRPAVLGLLVFIAHTFFCKL